MSNRFAKTFSAAPEHIDELGHVNNAVWLQWVQDIATAHWTAVAAPEQVERYVWVVTRHEIDYRRPVVYHPEPLRLELWIDTVRAAQFTVHYEVYDGDQLAAEASTVCVTFDFDSNRPRRLQPHERELLATWADDGQTSTVGSGAARAARAARAEQR